MTMWPWPERGINPKFTVSITDAAVNVECEVENYWETDRAELFRRALDLCRAVVSLTGFKMAIGLSVILDKYINPHGIETNLYGHDGRLPPLCTAIHDPNDLDTAFRIVLAEPILIRHLTDLLISISVPHECLINCGRVVDGIKHLISPNAPSEAKGWEFMRDALNIDRKYLELITDSSTDPRHGVTGFVGGLLCNEVVLRSWNVMNRFLEYRKLGNVRLPLADFPLLKG